MLKKNGYLVDFVAATQRVYVWNSTISVAIVAVCTIL